MQRIVERTRAGTSTVVEIGDAAEAVLTIREWAALIGVGYSSAKRMLAQGDGPVKLRLSRRRVGISASAHARWLRSREI